MAWCNDHSWHVCFIIETSSLALCNNFLLCYALAQSNEMHLHFHTFTVCFHTSTLTYHSQYSEAFKFSEFVFTKHNEGAKSEFAIILFGSIWGNHAVYINPCASSFRPGGGIFISRTSILLISYQYMWLSSAQLCLPTHRQKARKQMIYNTYCLLQ